MQRWMEQKMIRARRVGMVRSGAGKALGGDIWDDRVIRRGLGEVDHGISAPESRPSGHKTPAVVLRSDRPKAWNAKGRVRYV